MMPRGSASAGIDPQPAGASTSFELLDATARSYAVRLAMVEAAEQPSGILARSSLPYAVEATQERTQESDGSVTSGSASVSPSVSSQPSGIREQLLGVDLNLAGRRRQGGARPGHRGSFFMANRPAAYARACRRPCSSVCIPASAARRPARGALLVEVLSPSQARCVRPSVNSSLMPECDRR